MEKYYGTGRKEPENTRKLSYRHEFKYLCTNAQLAMLEVRLKGLMQKDPHAGAAGRYTVKSMYFDDMDDSCFMQNENGLAPRKNTGSAFTITARTGSAWNANGKKTIKCTKHPAC